MPDHIFRPGSVGLASRSGTLTYEIAQQISNAGLGQSTCVGIGGDAIIGLDFIRLLEMFKDDGETKGVVLLDEIGGNLEELAAQYISKTNYPKASGSLYCRKVSPTGKTYGAIIMGSTGTAKSKIDAFTTAGVPVAEKPSDVVKLLKV